MGNRRYSSMSKGATGGVVVGVIVLIFVLWAAVLTIGALALSWGWNLVVPSTFNGPTLDFGGALALLVVISVIRSFLFGGISYRKS